MTHIILVTNRGRLVRCDIPNDGFASNVKDKEWERGEVVVNSHLVEEKE